MNILDILLVAGSLLLAVLTVLYSVRGDAGGGAGKPLSNSACMKCIANLRRPEED